MPEPLSYSFHAVARCLERGITERNVTETVRLGNRIADDGDKAVYARGRMRVVLLGGGLVITAYRQRKRNPKRCIQKRRKLIRQYARGSCENAAIFECVLRH